ncbi:hypothetical protein TRVL_02170 [Trypanosoma vivax]|nr:hypothetical protein TRVL_02170 [Trypanosoma vivax]
MLSDEHVAILSKYYSTVSFTGEQRDMLIEKYWEASKEERKIIARAYASLFAKDATFAQRLLAYYDLHVVPTTGRKASGVQEGDETKIDENSFIWPTSTVEKVACNLQQQSRSLKPSKSMSGHTLSSSQLVLRTAIQDQYLKLTGDGPFPISFGLVLSEEERRESIDLYSMQFQYPDQPELQRLVILPQTHSTRTRRRAKGSYTWFLRSNTTGEMVCAVTIKAHNYETHNFVEVPLFATGVGYKKCGFGRLLNAALMQWCADMKFEFIMVSADVQAIPFWTHLGYKIMQKSELTRIAFYYEHNCYKFKGAEAMIRYCTQWPSEGVQKALSKMKNIVVSGPMSLPDS